jgi:ABC-type Fe3+-siderophore transport system permease subunit
MLELTPILVLLIIFGFIYGIVYLGVRRKERMTLLDRGADPSIFHDARPGIAGIRYGLLLIGVAVGILLGNIIEATTCLEEEVSYFSMIFLFGGIALVMSYFLERNHNKGDQNPKDYPKE